MSRISGVIIFFWLCSLVLIYIIWNHSERIHFEEKKVSIDSEILQDDIKNTDIGQQGTEYVADLKKIIEEYKELINSLDGSNQKLNDTKESDLAKIKSFNEKLEGQIVPVSFKEFHLLFSRSLLRLSKYLNSNDPKDKAASKELFNEAVNKFDFLLNNNKI